MVRLRSPSYTSFSTPCPQIHRFKLHGTLISCPFFANGDIDLNRFSEPVYRLAEQEWKDFVSEFSDILVEEVDDQVPPLPPKDCIMRIYRDVRFSNDKTPYKKNFSASFSRGGRKGIFAHCE